MDLFVQYLILNVKEESEMTLYMMWLQWCYDSDRHEFNLNTFRFEEILYKISKR